MDNYHRDLLIKILIEVNNRRFDPILWRKFLLKGLQHLFQCNVSALVEKTFTDSDDQIGNWDITMSDNWSPKTISKHGESLDRVKKEGNYLDNPYWLPQISSKEQICFSGVDFLGEHKYQQNPFVSTMLRPAGYGDGLIIAFKHNESQIELQAFRANGDKNFADKEKEMFLFIAGLLQQYISGFAPINKPSFTTLAPRPKQVMSYLLQGYSEKETANQMNISHQTVHDYKKTIFRHFNVHSQAELTASFLGFNAYSLPPLLFRDEENLKLATHS